MSNLKAQFMRIEAKTEKKSVKLHILINTMLKAEAIHHKKMLSYRRKLLKLKRSKQPSLELGEFESHLGSMSDKTGINYTMLRTKEAVNQPVNTLPEFTETIKLEIEVSDIYKRMKNVLPEDYKHRDILAHAIVGSAAENGGLLFVYNALAGFDNTVDFQVGDEIMCSAEERNEKYDANVENEKGESVASVMNPADPEYKPKWKNKDVEIGKCIVKQINLYSGKKLLVEFEQHHKYRDTPTVETVQMWVNHRNCAKWAVQPV